MYRIRISLGALLLSIVLGLFYLEYTTHIHWAIVLLIALLTGFSWWEFSRMVRQKGYTPLGLIGLLGSLLLIGMPWLQARSWFPFPGQNGAPALLCLILIAVFLQCLAVVMRTGSLEKIVENGALTVLGVMYLGFSLSYLVQLRFLGPHGLLYVLLVVLVAKSMDIGGYLIGKPLGRHRLAPPISPKKSLEGSLGGLVLAIGVSWGMTSYIPALGMVLSGIWPFIFGFLIGLLSLMGDLAESLIKRWCGVKDSAQLIPEFGGIMDLVDSLTFAAPVGYYFLLFFMEA